MANKEEISKIADLERQINILKKTKDPDYEKVLTLLCQQITVLLHDEYFPEEGNNSDVERKFRSISNRTNNFLAMNDYEPIFLENGANVVNENEIFVEDLVKTNNKELDGKIARTNTFGLKKDGKILKAARVSKYDYVESEETKKQKFGIKDLNFVTLILSLVFTLLCFTQKLAFVNTIISFVFLALLTILVLQREKECSLNFRKTHFVNHVIIVALLILGVVYSCVSFNLTPIIEGVLLILFEGFTLIDNKTPLLKDNVIRSILKNKFTIFGYSSFYFILNSISSALFNVPFKNVEILPYIVLLIVLTGTMCLISILDKNNSKIEKIIQIIYIIIIYSLSLLYSRFCLSTLIMTLLIIGLNFTILFGLKIRRKK